MLSNQVADSSKENINVKKRICQFCGSTKTYVKPSGYEQWFNDENGFICRKCHDKRRIRNSNYIPHPRIYKKRENPEIECKCGCGGKLLKYGSDGKERQFLFNHHRRKEITPDKEYEYVYAPDHPHKNHRNKVYKHRLVMEAHIGRYLRLDEFVHHKDRNPKNNNISNLQIMSKPDHTQYHRLLDKSDWFCLFCHEKTYIDKTKHEHWFDYNSGHICEKCFRAWIKTSKK